MESGDSNPSVQDVDSFFADGESIDTRDVLKKAIHKVFGCTQIPSPNEKSQSNSSVFLTEAGRNLMFPVASGAHSAENSLYGLISSHRETAEWSR